MATEFQEWGSQKRERQVKLFAFYDLAWSHTASLTPTQVQKDTTSDGSGKILEEPMGLKYCCDVFEKYS